LPTGIGHLELLDIPGRWERVDAFARGRVETSPPDIAVDLHGSAVVVDRGGITRSG
jgi:hypothetical protein